jgi:predicted dehydrogenase
MAKVGVGVVGCGGNGRRHAELYNSMDEVELIGVYDMIPEAAERVAKQHRVKAFTSIEELVNDDRVEAINAVNSGSHAGPVVAAGNAGKHVLVEVPFAVTVEECDRMIEATEKGGVNLMYAQTHRYYPYNVTIKSMIDAGEIGDLIWITFTRTGSGDPTSDKWHRWKKTGGGTLTYEGPHYTDQIRWLAGSDYDTAVVIGMGRYASGGDGEDTVIGGFTFKNGVFAALIDAKANPGGNYSDWRIGGTEGMIEIKGTVARLGKGDWVDIDYPHKNDPPVEGFERLSEATHYRGFLTEFQEFIASINEGRPPASTGYDGRASIEAALALRKAGETGQPVKFPL